MSAHMRATIFALFVFGSISCRHPEGALHADHASHSFEHAEEWAKRFEDPKRDAWQKPDEVVKALALAEDAKVADIGSATGYFPVRYARATPKGMVYGVDIESSMVEYLNARAKSEGLANLLSVLGAPDDAKIPEPVDVVTVVNTYHHIEQRTAYFTKLAASLKPGARVAIIDFKKSSAMGPPAAAKVAPEAVVSELEAAGYKKVASFDFLAEQFFLVFSR